MAKTSTVVTLCEVCKANRKLFDEGHAISPVVNGVRHFVPDTWMNGRLDDQRGAFERWAAQCKSGVAP